MNRYPQTLLPGDAGAAAGDTTNKTNGTPEPTSTAVAMPSGSSTPNDFASKEGTMNNTTINHTMHTAAAEEAVKQATATPGVEIPVHDETPQAAQASAPRRMLYRHPSDRVLGGVCAGLADFTGLDVALIRILWFVATIATGGGGILAYGALWLLLPVGTTSQGQVRPPALELNERNLGRAAMLLIGLGVLWLLANMGVLPWLWSGFWWVMGMVFWPLLLIGVGYMILRYTGRGEFNWDWRKSAEQAKSTVGERLPSRESMGARMRAARARFPLKRSRTDRIFMGVCGGIGRRVGIDPNLVRLVWAAFSVGSIGVGVLVYVVTGLLLPEEPVFDPALNEQGEPVQVIDVKTTQV
jgi:phage shock protein C